MRVNGALRVWQRNFTVYTKLYRSSLALNFMEPMLYLVGMGLGLGGFIENMNGQSYVEFIAPGLIASSSMFASTFECTYGTYVRMVHQKTFDAILATPVSLTELIVGELIWGATKSALYGTIIVIVLVGFGLVHSPMIMLATPVLLVSGLLFSSLGLIYTALIPVIYYFNYYFTLFMTPLFLFSGIFFPLDRLPDTLIRLAYFTPLYHLVNVMRALAVGRFPGADILWLMIVAAVLIPYAIRLMRRRVMEPS